MSRISVKNLTFSYEESFEEIFKDVTFSLDTEWKTGLIGRNGRGKTTFLQLLMGAYDYRGSISANTEFSYFPYTIRDTQRRAEEVAEEICPGLKLWQLSRELNRLSFELDRLSLPFAALSSGEQTKVLLAVLFLKENHFLLIDEPTNHLDTKTRAQVADYLNTKKGFLLVSHDRSFLDSCIDHVLSINRTDITVAKGNFSVWWENRKRQEQFEQSEQERLKKEIGKLKDASRRAEDWANMAERSKIGNGPCKVEPGIGKRSYLGEKSRKMRKRQKALEERQSRALEEKQKLLKNREEAKPLKILPLEYHKQVLAEAKDFGILYGEKAVVRHLDFQIRKGERILLSGKNGCGKSSVFQKLLGEDFVTEGTLNVPENLVISYVPQKALGLEGRLEDFMEEQGLNAPLYLAVLRKLDFSREQFEKKMEFYSAGQKKKVLLAKSLCEQAHLYIWDEPLNYIDLFSRMQLEELVFEKKPTMLFAEHDKLFAEHTATKVIQL